ncbi:MAG: hypothetical protein M1839_003427 [Geoglossum umbratile]|nr:MAG: hypothetical protein M1839_003427 [Geoglossum umbratile]
MSEANIVVVGAGVSGLTSAFLLARRNLGYKITIVAKHMPGDYDPEYASPWAGANYMPLMLRSGIGIPGTSFTAWLRGSRRLVFIFKVWRFRSRYTKKGLGVVTECGPDLIIYNREKDAHSTSADWFAELLSADPWFKDLVLDVCDSAVFCEQKQSGSYVPLKFNVVSKEKLPPGVDSATKWKSVCINTALYLPWLASQCLQNGVVIKRGVLGHISEAVGLHHTGKRADFIVNCTGLLASRLGGVMDKNVIPVRGQIVVVRNDPGIMATISGTDEGDDEVTYVMHRAAGGGTILGGSYEKGKADPTPDPNLAQRIMKRCIELAPGLTNGKGVEALSIVRHAVGLRPLRIGGVRLEKEMIDGVWTVHNYGHGGFGYQASYGCSQVVVRLVEEALSARARL